MLQLPPLDEQHPYPRNIRIYHEAPSARAKHKRTKVRVDRPGRKVQPSRSGSHSGSFGSGTSACAKQTRQSRTKGRVTGNKIEISARETVVMDGGNNLSPVVPRCSVLPCCVPPHAKTLSFLPKRAPQLPTPIAPLTFASKRTQKRNHPSTRPSVGSTSKRPQHTVPPPVLNAIVVFPMYILLHSSRTKSPHRSPLSNPAQSPWCSAPCRLFRFPS